MTQQLWSRVLLTNGVKATGSFSFDVISGVVARAWCTVCDRRHGPSLVDCKGIDELRLSS